MKPLKPSMKENKRYLLVKGKNLKQNIEKAILDYVGSAGMSKAGLNFIKSSTGSAIISINRGAINHVRGALAIYPEKMGVEKVSGTLKGLGKK